jgi:hypothetical protein
MCVINQTAVHIKERNPHPSTCGHDLNHIIISEYNIIVRAALPSKCKKYKTICMLYVPLHRPLAAPNGEASTTD